MTNFQRLSFTIGDPTPRLAADCSESPPNVKAEFAHKRN